MQEIKREIKNGSEKNRQADMQTGVPAHEETMFREYDLRGVFGRELTPDFAKGLGRAYCTYLRNRIGKHDVTISVGRDVRLSSDELAAALIEGIASCGVNVYDLGSCPTPLLYYSLFSLDVNGGIMITGSHNPPEYNGFKICVGKETIHGSEIQDLKTIYYSDNDEIEEVSPGRVEKYDIIRPYSEHIKELFSEVIDLPGIKIAVDAGNGAGGLLAADLFRSLGCDVIELYCEADGHFPNHHPDPTVEENLKDLVEVVQEKSCDFGIAFDGDADRLGAVDEKGNILWGDKLMILYATEIIKNSNDCKFIGEVKCSQVMYDEIARLGGEPIMWKTGHSLIKAKIKEENAELAGEMSGHFFFADRYFGYDDALYAACRLIEIVRKRKAQDNTFPGIGSLLDNLEQTYVTPEIKVSCLESEKKRTIDVLGRVFEKHKADGSEPKIKDIISIDGLRVVFNDGWGLIRASNTQPALIMRFEATSEKRRDILRAFMEEQLKTAVYRG